MHAICNLAVSLLHPALLCQGEVKKESNIEGCVYRDRYFNSDVRGQERHPVCVNLHFLKGIIEH